MKLHRTWMALVLSILVVHHGYAEDGIAFFEQKIRPVLVEHCYECHSAQSDKLRGNLFLDSKTGWETGGDSGEAVVVPGNPDESYLIRTVMHLEGGMEMPPDKPKLPDAVIADLVTWVKMGAPDPRDGMKLDARRADKSWWSLQPLMKFDDESIHNNNRRMIDGIMDAKLKEKNLSRNPVADPRSLIRRMSYDVIGLPPSPDEVDAFVALHRKDPDQAVEQLIERLLASPRYGERWGRHWLDVIRFGESNGFERNIVIDDLWPFRDYVIRSINEDKPFNQFIVEHLAGDVMGKDDPNVEVASAFLVAGPYDDVGNQSVEAQANIRAATLDDIITATSGAFLGLTINCARCHHHKFDPIPTEDYYRLKAAFEGVTHGRRVVAGAEQRKANAAALKPLQQKLEELTGELQSLNRLVDTRAKEAAAKIVATRPKVDPHGTEESFSPTQAMFVRFIIHGFTTVPASTKRQKTVNGKLTEVQVWNTDEVNIALASNGTTAEGAKSTTAEDFPEAYGPHYCIDGKTGEAWFIGDPPVLTLHFAKSETIHRLTFINARGERGTDESKVAGATPSEYEIQVSMDGETWTTVATDEGREPWSAAHRIAKARSSVITGEEESRLDKLEEQIAAVQRQINQVPKLPQMWVGTHSQPKSLTHVHQGGDPMKPGEAVAPASLHVLDRVTTPFVLEPDADQGQRRLTLAKWITSDDNPLTSRVLANRVWQYHFGTGIVDTPSDFGFLGSLPSHPELLDYLATRLVEHGWKLKPLHREILLSQTYQQSAEYKDEAAKEDKDSRLLWRFPPRRLSAEELRDTMLSVAGKLQLEPMGGPGFRLYKFTQNNVCTYFPLDLHGPETFRRAVYHQNARASVVDVLTDFDLPDIAFASPKRANTTTPLQALTLLNHRFTIDMSAALASRLGEKSPVVDAYRILFQRQPSPREQEASSDFINDYGLNAFCRALLNANELIYLE